jgi:hypothetical protein
MGVEVVWSRPPRTFWFYMVVVHSANHPNIVKFSKCHTINKQYPDNNID